MSTTLVKPAEVERKWYLLDAAGKSLGHVAAEAAVLLRGKQKVDYTPNVDCGDFVVVINCDKAVLTGKKAEQKFHITHSKFIGGLKKVQYSKLMAENSDLAMTYAVKGMIPSNTIGAKALTRLFRSAAPVFGRHPVHNRCLVSHLFQGFCQSDFLDVITSGSPFPIV